MLDKIQIGDKIGRWKVIDTGPYKSNRKAWICKCECGNIYNVLQQSLKIGDSTQCIICKNKQNAAKNFKDLTDQTFNQWKVIKYHNSKNRTSYWECLCSCGRTRYIKTDSLISGSSKSCGKCRSYQDINSRYWDKIKWSAKKRNIDFNLDIKDAWNLYVKQGRICAISGLPISFKDNTASLDRIDSSLNYNIDNVQWLHKLVNTMKWDLDQEEFIRLCGLIYEKNNYRYRSRT